MHHIDYHCSGIFSTHKCSRPYGQKDFCTTISIDSIGILVLVRNAGCVITCRCIMHSVYYVFPGAAECSFSVCRVNVLFILRGFRL